MIEAVQNQLEKRPEFKPDVILIDGNGILHPQRFGSACHVGVGKSLRFLRDKYSNPNLDVP